MERSAPQVEGCWICDAREDMREAHCGSEGTEQVASRVWARRGGERVAVKKALEVWGLFGGWSAMWFLLEVCGTRLDSYLQ